MSLLGSVARLFRRTLGIERAAAQRQKQIETLRRIAESQVEQVQLLRRLLRATEKHAERQLLPRHAEIAAYLERHQLSGLETLARVRAERLSLARFGDGEFDRMAKQILYHANFQRPTPGLRADLRQVLQLDGYEGVPLLVALPSPELGNSFWRATWHEYWDWLRPLLRDDLVYGNAMVSRESFFVFHGEAAVNAWRTVWAGEDVCILTGEGSRFVAVEPLFSSARSIRWLYSKPVEAYEDLPRFIDKIRTEVPRTTLCLIALGPAGTVLAAKLARDGYWAVDLGHINNTYEHGFSGTPRPEDLPMTRVLPSPE